MSAFTDTLRTVAVYLDGRPDGLPHPQVNDSGVTWHLNGEPNWREVALDIMRDLGGQWSVKPVTNFVTLQTTLPEWGEVTIYAPMYEDAPRDMPRVDYSGFPGIA